MQIKRITRRGIVLATTAAAIVAVAAPAASAHEVEVVGGKTKLTLSGRAASALKTLGVTAKGTAYKATGGIYSFHPLDDGGGGTIKHSGALRLTKGSTTVKLAKLVIDLPAAEEHEKVLTALVAGRRITVATLNTKSYKVLDEDPGFTGLKLVLDKPAAKLLNTRFSTTAFKKGLVLGTLGNTSKVKEIPE